jgi:dimethylaniline monooxygenase (N-oxide forming)
MGIVGVKNLVEEGFDVTGFEASNYVGGVWHYTDDEDTLSVLRREWLLLLFLLRVFRPFWSC